MRVAAYRSLLAIVLVTAVFVPAQGQIQHGTITGVITDPTGALISNAVVRLDPPVAGQRLQLARTGWIN